MKALSLKTNLKELHSLPSILILIRYKNERRILDEQLLAAI